MFVSHPAEGVSFFSREFSAVQSPELSTERVSRVKVVRIMSRHQTAGKGMFSQNIVPQSACLVLSGGIERFCKYG